MGGHRLEPVIAFLRVAQAMLLGPEVTCRRGQVEEFAVERAQII
jgi:hypothetical protein